MINLVDSSFLPELHYRYSFDLVLKELGATFCPLSRFWTSLTLLHIKNKSGIKLLHNKKYIGCVYPIYEPPEWNLWVWLWLSLWWFHSDVTLMTSAELLLKDALTSNQKWNDRSDAGHFYRRQKQKVFLSKSQLLSRLWNISSLPWQKGICCLSKASINYTRFSHKHLFFLLLNKRVPSAGSECSRGREKMHTAKYHCGLTQVVWSSCQGWLRTLPRTRASNILTNSKKKCIFSRGLWCWLSCLLIFRFWELARD